MADVSISTVRKRFADKMATLSGFTESRNPLGTIRTPQSVAHKRFWVGVDSSKGRPDDRQTGRVLMETGILVKFSYRLRPKDQITDLDSALDSGEDVIQLLTTRSAPLHSDLQIRFISLQSELAPSGEFVIETIEFNVIHTISL